VNGLVGQFDSVVVGRSVLTLVLCGLIGLERSTHERASGLRPHILVGLGACLMTQAGAYGFADVVAFIRDPLRVASYVVSGIGFLGAGAILRHGTTVRGLTTAASLWGAAGIGIAVGTGMGGLAAVTVGLVLFTLTPLQRLEARFRLGPAPTGLSIHVSDANRAVGKALAALARLGVPVQQATVLPGAGTSAVLRIELARALAPGRFPVLIEQLLTLKCVERVETTSLRGEDDHPMPDDGVRTEAIDRPIVINVEPTPVLWDLDDPDGEEESVRMVKRSPDSAVPGSESAAAFAKRTADVDR
jgi:putative Mg2+ transporter-C (MgtC) family protein